MNRKMDRERALEIIKNSKYGILSTSSVNNIPYGVAINYYYDEIENALYFHTKRVGTKIDNIKNNPHVSLFILSSEEIVLERFIHIIKALLHQELQVLF